MKKSTKLWIGLACAAGVAYMLRKRKGMGELTCPAGFFQLPDGSCADSQTSAPTVPPVVTPVSTPVAGTCPAGYAKINDVCTPQTIVVPPPPPPVPVPVPVPTPIPTPIPTPTPALDCSGRWMAYQQKQAQAWDEAARCQISGGMAVPLPTTKQLDACGIGSVQYFECQPQNPMAACANKGCNWYAAGPRVPGGPVYQAGCDCTSQPPPPSPVSSCADQVATVNASFLARKKKYPSTKSFTLAEATACVKAGGMMVKSGKGVNASTTCKCKTAIRR